MPDSLPPDITSTPGVTWQNKHQTVSAQVERLYEVWNRWRTPAGGSERGDWLAGLRALQQIVRDAQAAGKRVRAFGGNWSLSDAGLTRDYLLDTKPLNFSQVGLSAASLDPGFNGTREWLVFTQCGTSVLELSQHLEAAGLSLPTSGASNGQTIAGAISTGTHGAAVSLGSMQDLVLALHLVGEGGTHRWIERATRPVISAAFCANIGAELIRDDALFEAALVSFGSFGVIHAVVFQAEPLFTLERHVRRHDYDLCLAAITDLDMYGLRLPDGNSVPFHFEVVVDPYALGRDKQGARVRCMYKRPFAPAPAGAATLVVTRDGDDVVSLVAGLTDLLPGAIAGALPGLIDGGVPATPPEGERGTHSQIFNETILRGPVLSTELGVALADADRAVRVIAGVAGDFPFAGMIALRFVKASRATLAFTRFRDTTCTIELPMAGSPRSREALERIWAALDAAGITYTLHWGQCLPASGAWVRKAHGAAVDAWLAARARLLPTPAGRRMFANELLERYGLAG